MQSGILYLKNYYQKIGLEMEHLKKTGHFFGDNHFYEKLRQKKKKNLATEVRKNLFYKINTIKSFL